MCQQAGRLDCLCTPSPLVHVAQADLGVLPHELSHWRPPDRGSRRIRWHPRMFTDIKPAMRDVASQSLHPLQVEVGANMSLSKFTVGDVRKAEEILH